MTREEAVNKYLSTRIKALETIQRLMLWDENKTIEENARNLRMKFDNAKIFSYSNNLKFKKRKSWYNEESPRNSEY